MMYQAIVFHGISSCVAHFNVLYICKQTIVMLLTENDYHIVTAKVWWLEMHNDPTFALPPKPEITFSLLEKPVDTNLYRDLYKAVGLSWNWLDRLAIDDEALSKKINASNIDIYVLKINGADAGYAEFAIEKDYTEIVYFGLMPGFTGKGYGKFFLQWVVNKAWSYKPAWIQLNTCSLDHPNALNVHQSTGFQIVNNTTEERKFLNAR